MYLFASSRVNIQAMAPRILLKYILSSLFICNLFSCSTVIILYFLDQVHADLLSRSPGLAASHVAPVMKILHSCINNGPPHPEELNTLLEVSLNHAHAHLHEFCGQIPINCIKFLTEIS